ncbi:MAG: FHA domain-containing protein [Bdellovibrionota bacterium]
MEKAEKKYKLPKHLGAIVSFTFGSEKGRQFPLVYTRTVIGRKKGDILVRDSNVSSTHTAIDYRRGIFHVVDLGSMNGTFLEDQPVVDQKVQVEQEVRLGETGFIIEIDPEKHDFLLKQKSLGEGMEGGLSKLLEDEFFAHHWDDDEEPKPAPRDQAQTIAKLPVEKQCMKLRVIVSSEKQVKLKFVKERVVIGREGVDLILNDRSVSKRHAQLDLAPNGEVTLTDLASANGTHVNGKRIKSKILSPNDHIKLGRVSLVFVGVEYNG